MQSRTDMMSAALAGDGTVSDYDLWRARRRVETDIERCRRLAQPLPIDLLYARRVIETARIMRSRPER